MTYLGIDPGVNGAIVALTEHEKELLTTKTIRLSDVSDFDLYEWLVGLWDDDSTLFAVLEKVGGFIQGNPAPGSSMFRFGVGYGKLLMALTAAGIPFEEVTPQFWQKGLGIAPRRKKGKGRSEETKTEFKNRLKAKAQQLFPREKVTLATADALLIAEFCRRKREGKL